MSQTPESAATPTHPPQPEVSTAHARAADLQPQAPIGAVILATATTRLRNQPDLLWSTVAHRPVLAWSITACAEAARLACTVVIVAPEHLAATRDLIAAAGWQRTTPIAVASGTRWRDALCRGLEALPSNCVWALLHDGARPLLTPQLLGAAIAATQTLAPGSAASAAIPVKETIKQVQNNVVAQTLERERLALLQTPQVFPRAALLDATLCLDADADPTDAATLAHLLGMPLTTFPGSHDNLKVASLDDLAVVEALLTDRRR